MQNTVSCVRTNFRPKFDSDLGWRRTQSERFLRFLRPPPSAACPAWSSCHPPIHLFIYFFFLTTRHTSPVAATVSPRPRRRCSDSPRSYSLASYYSGMPPMQQLPVGWDQMPRPRRWGRSSISCARRHKAETYLVHRGNLSFFISSNVSNFD